MYGEGYRSGQQQPREGGGGSYISESGRRSPGRRRDDDWDRDRDYYRSRKEDSRSPRRRYHDHDRPPSSYHQHHHHDQEQAHHGHLPPRPARGDDYGLSYYDDDRAPDDGGAPQPAGDLGDPLGLPRGDVGGRVRGGLGPGRPRGSPSPSRDRDRDRAWAGLDDAGDDGLPRGAGGRHRPGADHQGQHPGRHRTSPCLILGGFPDCVVEQDILMGLDYATENPNFSAEQIQSVRVRNSKRGSRIAFVDFHRLSDAERFYDDFASITFPLQHSCGIDSDPVTVSVDFSKKPREESENWLCPTCGGVNYPQRELCFKCKSERPDNMQASSSYGQWPVLTGETDEDPKQMPSQFVVIRDLEPSVTEEVLAKGVMKLFREDAPQPAKDTTKHKLKSTAPTASNLSLGAAPGSLRRVFLVRDRTTNESWRYGFAEFATIEDARGAVAKYHALPKFTISSKLVIVAFIHAGVFVPALEPPAEESARFSFAPIYNPSVRVKYWDERAYPNILVITAGPEPAPTDESAEKSTGQKNSQAAQDASAKKSRKDREALANRIASKMAGVAMAPQMQMWAKKSAEIHGASRKGTGEGVDTMDDGPGQGSMPGRPAADGGAASGHVEESTDPVAPSWRDQYVSYADWDTIECLLCGKFSLEEWLIYHETHVHNHFKDENTKARAAALLSARGKQPRTIVRRTPRRKCDAPQPYTSYADQDSLACYLCMRKLPDVKTLRRHEQESELHKRNLSSPAKVESATTRLLAETGWKPTRMLPLGYDGPLRLADKNRGYRDRARERREVYNQPHKPRPGAGAATGGGGAPGESTTSANKRKPAAAGEEEGEGSKTEPPPPAKKSKGAGLLAKMGWSAGEGLGASGEGRREAVGAEVYVPGVGLGAEGGKLGDAAEEAARKTRGDQGGFVEKTREKARERFERLG